MKVLTKVSLFLVLLLVGSTFFWVISMYSCPHFLVFPSSKSLAQRYISGGKLASLDSKFTNATIRNSNITVECGQGSDDELEVATVSFEYSSNNKDWKEEHIRILTDFDAVLFSEREVVEVIYQTKAYSP